MADGGAGQIEGIACSPRRMKVRDTEMAGRKLMGRGRDGGHVPEAMHAVRGGGSRYSKVPEAEGAAGEIQKKPGSRSYKEAKAGWE